MFCFFGWGWGRFISSLLITAAIVLVIFSCIFLLKLFPVVFLTSLQVGGRLGVGVSRSAVPASPTPALFTQRAPGHSRSAEPDTRQRAGHSEDQCSGERAGKTASTDCSDRTGPGAERTVCR